MADSNAKPATRTSAKTAREKLPPPKKKKGFPLTPHATGKWQKKVHGKTYYFGSWAKRENGELVRLEDNGRDEALAVYNRFVFEQLYGRPPAATHGEKELSVGALCNQYRNAQQCLLESGDIKPKTLSEYLEACDLIVAQFTGPRPVSTLGPNDFRQLRSTLAAKWGIERFDKFIGYTKKVFSWGADEGLIKHVIAYGQDFKKTKADIKRKHKEPGGERMFTRQEIWELLEGRKASRSQDAVKPASTQMRAMIFLGINDGMGNTDVALLPLKRINLKSGFIDYPRTKNGIKRRCPLWPETIKALQAVLKERANMQSEMVFLTRFSNPWVNGKVDSVCLEFSKRMKALDINGRSSLGFYSLRHTFRTVADETLDPVAIDLVMGHVTPGVAARYRQRIDEQRLSAVTDYVRKWLVGKPRARKPK
jgi:integrase